MDEFDEDIYDDELDDLDDDFDDDLDDLDNDLDDDLDEDLDDDLDDDLGSRPSIYEIESAGMFDGENDSVERGGVLYGSYGMSVDLDELDDEERDHYEQGYMMGAQGY